MFVAISPSSARKGSARVGDAAMQRARGAARLALSGSPRGPRIDDLYQRSPCRVLMPRVDGRDRAEIVFANTAGGIAGGDELAYEVRVGAGASATITTQAAEKVYGAIDRDARLSTALTVGEGGFLEWLPQQTIVFDGARLRRSTTIDVTGTGRVLALDWLMMGRLAHGEVMARGTLRDDWRVRRDGRLAWADAFRLAGDPAALSSRRAALGGNRALATLLHAGPGAGDLLEAARGWVARCGCDAGASVVGGMLVMRFLAPDGLSLQRAVDGVLAVLRPRLAGSSAAIPRLWTC